VSVHSEPGCEFSSCRSSDLTQSSLLAPCSTVFGQSRYGRYRTTDHHRNHRSGHSCRRWERHFRTRRSMAPTDFSQRSSTQAAMRLSPFPRETAGFNLVCRPGRQPGSYFLIMSIKLTRVNALTPGRTSRRLFSRPCSRRC